MQRHRDRFAGRQTRSTGHELFDRAPSLDKAGVLVGFHTDDGITDSRLFLRSAALGVRAGLPRDKALYAMTMAGAKMLDLPIASDRSKRAKTPISSSFPAIRSASTRTCCRPTSTA